LSFLLFKHFNIHSGKLTKLYPGLEEIVDLHGSCMLQFAQQVMASHDKANKQADLDVSPAMGDMLTEMQGCLTQLYGNAAIRDLEAEAQLIAEKQVG